MSVSPSMHPAQRWKAHRVKGVKWEPAAATPKDAEAGWRPLVQHTNLGEPETKAFAGWVCIRWHAAYLEFDLLFFGGPAHNAAQKLNDRAWELGDVAEIFLQSDPGRSYLELQITPENQRLQLIWPPGALLSVRTGVARLENFMISEPTWVTTSTKVTRDWWAALARIPADALGLQRYSPKTQLRVAVCRYKYGADSGAILSTTASVPFHQFERWAELRLDG